MSRNDLKTFGAWLRGLRNSLKLTQGQVARRAGVSPSYISTLERCPPHTVTKVPVHPERDKVISIAKALKADPNEALVLAGYMPNHLSEVPDAIRVIGFEELNEADVDAIVDFIRWRKQTKKRKGQ